MIAIDNFIAFFSRPDLVDISEIEKRDNRTNLEAAFDLAEKHLSVPKLLDVDGMFLLTCIAH